MAETSSRVRQAGAFAGGFAISSGASAALAYAASRAIGMGTKLSPAFARATASVLSAPVVLTATGAGAVYGGVKAVREGKSGAEIALATLGGAASLGTNIAADFISSAAAAPKKKAEPADDEEAALRRADGNLKRAEQSLNKAERNLKKVGIGETKNAAPAEPAEPPPPALPAGANAFDKRRHELNLELHALRRELAKETSRGGFGPNANRISARMRDIQTTDLPKVDHDQQAAPSAEKTAWALGMSAGAFVGGALFGGMLGSSAVKSAKAAANTAAKGIEKVANNAGKLVNTAQNGVIAGTPAGDKARAAIAAAQAKLGEKVVTNTAAFGIPALNLAHGTASVVGSGNIEDKTVSAAVRTEGMFAIAAGVVGLKYGLVARAVKPVVSLDAQAKLQAAAGRLSREARSGPAGVAQAKGRAQVASAQAAAQVAAVDGNAKVAAAAGKAKVATAAGKAKIAAAEGKAKAAAVKGQSAVAAQKTAQDVAAVRGATRVKMAKAQATVTVAAARTAAAQNAAALSRQQMEIAARTLAPHRTPAAPRPMNASGPRGWSEEARIASALKRGVALPGTGPRAGRARTPAPPRTR